VKALAKTMNQDSFCIQGVWITPLVLAIFGITAALCVYILALI